jgi:hypothetical protein
MNAEEVVNLMSKATHTCLGSIFYQHQCKGKAE